MNIGTPVERIESERQGWLFSRGIELEGTHGPAFVRFAWPARGEIHMPGTVYRISKQGRIKQTWTLDLSGLSIAEASLPSLSQEYWLESPMGDICLKRGSWLDRSFTAWRGSDLLLQSSPPPMFTSTSSLDLYTDHYDWPTICFLYWLIERDRRAKRRADRGRDE